MLDELRVANLGIIEGAHLEPGPGLVVVTGETGAGKTLLLGALRLLLGAAGRKEAIGPFGPELEVEGRFVDGDGNEMTLRRRITTAGRSKAYVDDAMAPVRTLTERTDGMVEVIGQHDQMTLTTPRGVRGLLDGALDAAGEAARASYREAWERLAALRQRARRLGGDRRELERELDLVRYQADEIAAAGFAPGDDAELQARAVRLRNSETLLEGLAAAQQALDDEGAGGYLTAAMGELRRLAAVDPELASLAQQAGEAAEALGAVAGEIAIVAEDLDHDPAELAELEERIALLGTLRRKYGETLDEVLEFGAGATRRAAELTALLDSAGKLQDEIAAAEEQARTAAGRLRGAREEMAGRLAAAARGHLQELGMSDPVVTLAVAEAPLGPDGADRVTLEFASDASLTPGPVGKVASGGELSRLVLALRLAAGAATTEVVAFDEIDAGVGGATARALGEKLAALSRGRQILCVTHLPQVAAHADTHYVLERDGAKGRVRELSGEDRVAELARMLAGMPESEKGQEHAAELLAAAGHRP